MVEEMQGGDRAKACEDVGGIIQSSERNEYGRSSFERIEEDRAGDRTTVDRSPATTEAFSNEISANIRATIRATKNDQFSCSDYR